MIVLEAGANNVIVTLNESKTIEVPEYIFIFVHDDRSYKRACKVGAELSDYPERYNKFLITVTEDADPQASEVELTKGFHHYYVYEIEDAGDFDFENVDTLDLETMEGLVECGKMKYIEDPEELEYYRNMRQSIQAYD